MAAGHLGAHPGSVRLGWWGDGEGVIPAIACDALAASFRDGPPDRWRGRG